MNSAEAEKMFKEDKGLLAKQESVELAYKAKKDFFLFTTKRFIIVDHKSGFMGMNAKDEYISIPYKSIKGFSVQSASGWFDKDSEMMLWTEVCPNEPEEKKTDDDPPSVYYKLFPGLSFKSFDFKKDQIDLLLLHKLLSARICPLPSGGTTNFYLLTSTTSSSTIFLILQQFLLSSFYTTRRTNQK